MDIELSVIVPVFNGENVIMRAIDSILKAATPKTEVLVVNDGSTDSTADLLRSICDARVKVIEQDNMGQGFARNTALGAARGEYVAFVDADDTLHPDIFSNMLQRARETGADMVQCNITDIYPDGHTAVQLVTEDKTVTVADRGRYTDEYFSTCRHSYEVCNKLIKRDVICKNNISFCDTRTYFSEDLLFNLKLIEHIISISFISEPYYNYYQHEDSHFHSNAEKRLAGVYKLFQDYITTADADMAQAASYTAAMVILYSLGSCALSGTATAILCDKFFKKCLRTALTRRCSIKHRLFLTAVRVLPRRAKADLSRRYSGRWT